MPILYWFGRKVSHLPFDSLPEHYVIKPNLGFSRNNVYVMAKGTDLFEKATFTKQQLGRNTATGQPRRLGRAGFGGGVYQNRNR